MEKTSFQKESDRMSIAAAAIAVADSHADNFLLGEVIPEERRRYLFAVPESASTDGAFTTEELANALRGEDVPHAVNWDRNHPRGGLRYLPDYVRVPEGLRGFAGERAQSHWSTWKKQESAVSASVADLAREVVENPMVDLYEGHQERIAFMASRMADRKKPAPRKSRDDERS